MPTTAASVSHLVAALRYASLGWQVIPLHTPEGKDGCSCGRATCDRSRGKHPRMSDWVKRASTDEGAIRGWWRTYPHANVGLVTGARSGFFVLDVDPDHGGEVSLAALIATHGALPATVEALTGSGGRHLLFKYPGHHIPNSTSRLGPGLDIRGDGGQIVAAPSMHYSGGTYEWQRDCEPGRQLADAPSWLLELIHEPVRVAPTPRSQPIDQAARRASAYLAKLPGAVSGERGHEATWTAALAIVRGFRLSEPESLALLLSEYNPRCTPPWSEKELAHKVASAAHDATVAYGYLLDSPSPERRTSERRTESGDPRPDPPPPVALVAAPALKTPTRREPGVDDDDESDDPLTRLRTTGLDGVELLSLQLPPIIWLVDQLIEVESTTCIYGPPNGGKTFLLLELICRVLEVGKRAVLYEEEGSAGGIQSRFRRAAAAHHLSEEQLRAFRCVHNGCVDLSAATTVASLVVHARDHRADFIGLDSLAAMSGGGDENDSSVQGQLSNTIHRLKVETKAAVVVLHHMTKEGWKPNEKPSLRTLRGHSSLPGRLDAALAVIQSEEDTTEAELAFDLVETKRREGMKTGSRRCTVAMPSAGPEASFDMREMALGAKVADQHKARVAEISRQTLEIVRQAMPAGIAARELREALPGRNGDKADALAALLQSRQLTRSPTRRIVLPTPTSSEGYSED